jgi:hypothetical protein
MGVILHELATNSLKYGALSALRGWVAIRWSVAGNRLDLQWTERGGPAVSAPVKRGFGTTLIQQSAKSEGGKAEQLSGGITWKISVSLPQFNRREEAILVQPPSAAAVTTQKSATIATKATAQLAGDPEHAGAIYRMRLVSIPHTTTASFAGGGLASGAES